MMLPTTIVHLLSGGLDSTVLAYDLVKQGVLVHAVLFNYGQIHVKELQYARRHCEALRIEKTEVELFRIKGLFLKNALVDGTQPDLVVPYRNGVMLSIAAAIAASNNVQMVSYACNKDDQAEFPDCRWEFVESQNATLKASKTDVEVVAPYIGLTKWQIVQRAKEIGAPWEDTWSCYNPFNEQPCGKCSACNKRKEAIK